MAQRKDFKTTIYTLSELAGVSPSTISRALNNAPSISEDLRTRIHDLARANNFRPSPARTRVPNICVLIQRERLELDGYLNSVIGGISQYCYEANLEVSLFAAEIEEVNRVDILREFHRRNADGVILLQSSMESRFVQALEDAGFPFSIILDSAPTRVGRLLTVDNRHVTSCAVNYLLELGHRKIAVLANRHTESGRLRLKAYRETLQTVGISFDKQLVLAMQPDQLGQEFGYTAAQGLLRERPDVTAIFTLAHSMAVGAVHACYEWQVRIPRDLSLITCDDFPTTAYLCPALTAVRIPNQRLGYLAARQVHRLIRRLPDLPYSEHQTLLGELVIRKSTAAPRRTALLRLRGAK